MAQVRVLLQLKAVFLIFLLLAFEEQQSTVSLEPLSSLKRDHVILDYEHPCESISSVQKLLKTSKRR
jgi:hypothetical protein